MVGSDLVFEMMLRIARDQSINHSGNFLAVSCSSSTHRRQNQYAHTFKVYVLPALKHLQTFHSLRPGTEYRFRSSIIQLILLKQTRTRSII